MSRYGDGLAGKSDWAKALIGARNKNRKNKIEIINFKVFYLSRV